jgi:hypothetical protein
MIPTPQQTAEAVERMKKRSCVSEQSATGLLWTVFEAEPFCSRRIASFATEADAREFVYFIPAALSSAQKREQNLKASCEYERALRQQEKEEFQDTIDLIRSEAVELRKDKERLDWLNDFQTGNYETPYWKIYQVNPGQDLREAIDSAQNKK